MLAEGADFGNGRQVEVFVASDSERAKQTATAIAESIGFKVTDAGGLKNARYLEPLAGLMEQKIEEAGKELVCIKTTLLASMQGYAPQVAVEFGRKVLYSTERPNFTELESHVKGKK